VRELRRTARAGAGRPALAGRIYGTVDDGLTRGVMIFLDRDEPGHRPRRKAAQPHLRGVGALGWPDRTAQDIEQRDNRSGMADETVRAVQHRLRARLPRGDWGTFAPTTDPKAGARTIWEGTRLLTALLDIDIPRPRPDQPGGDDLPLR